MAAPQIDLSFPHRWQAQILTERPRILPARHFVYPQAVEEVERGALELLIQPYTPGAPGPGSPATGLRRRSGYLDSETWENNEPSLASQPFLATCALGFRDPAVPTGLWSSPKPGEVCCVAGGYAYLIDTAAPERFTMLPYRPVLQVLPAVAQGLLLFVGHRAILAWGAQGQAWESAPLSDEGITIHRVDGDTLHGLGWHMLTDKETPFTLDLRTGMRNEMS